MKILFKTLVGFGTALIVMLTAALIVISLDIDANKVNFFIGWISCMGYYIGSDIYEKNNPRKRN